MAHYLLISVIMFGGVLLIAFMFDMVLNDIMEYREERRLSNRKRDYIDFDKF